MADINRAHLFSLEQRGKCDPVQPSNGWGIGSRNWKIEVETFLALSVQGFRKIGAGELTSLGGKNSQPLKSEVKNPPHPPWFEACAHIHIMSLMF